jgi:hypothetical protein
VGPNKSSPSGHKDATFTFAATFFQTLRQCHVARGSPSQFAALYKQDNCRFPQRQSETPASLLCPSYALEAIFVLSA